MASIISAGTTAGTALNMTGDTTGNLAFQTGAGANTITVPNGTGTIAVNGVSTNIVSGTAVASTSGTSIDFTSIPSWVKRITVMFNSISTNGSAGAYIIQIGSGSVTTTGYTSQCWAASAGSNVVTTGFIFVTATGSASYTMSGTVVLTLIGSNTWVSNSSANYMNVQSPGYSGSGNSSALSGALDRVRITTFAGTETFDAGSINILYEG